MARHMGLGRGLDALLGDADFEGDSGEFRAEQPFTKLPKGISADSDGTLWVSPSLLRPNPKQPRTVFDEESLSELTESVRREGVLSPVIIEDAGDGTFFIIAGERRTRAAKNAGLDKIPVQLRHYSDERKLEIALIENIQRTDLNPLEEARAYSELMAMGNLTQDEVAGRVGKRRSTVANCVRLLKLPDGIQKAVIEGEITSGHARAILSLESEEDMYALYKKIRSDGLSVRQAEVLSKEIKDGREDKKPSSASQPADRKRDPNLAALEQKLIERLGTKVRIQGTFESGTVSISYFSSDDLDRIFGLIAPDASL